MAHRHPASADRDPAAITLVVAAIAVVAGLPLVVDRSEVDAFARPKAILLAVAIAIAALAAWLAPEHSTIEVRQPAWSRWAIAASGVGLLIGWRAAGRSGVSAWGEPLQFQGLIPGLLVVSVIPLAVAVVRTGRAIVVLRAASFASGTAGIYGVLQGLGVDPLWSLVPGERAFSTIGQPNAFAAYLVVGAAAGFAAAAGERSVVGRSLHHLGCAAALIAVGVTHSRGGYLAAVAGGMWFVVVALPLRSPQLHRWSWRRELPVLVGVSGAVGFGLGATPFGSQLATIAARAWSLTRGNADESLYHHRALWQAAVAMVRAHPLTGLGPDGFATAFEGYRDRVLPTKAAWELSLFRPESPHNVHLARFVDGGLIAGLGFLTLALGGAIAVARRARSTGSRPLAAISAGLFAHFVASSFITGELAGEVVAAALLAIGMTVPAAQRHTWRIGHDTFVSVRHR